MVAFQERARKSAEHHREAELTGAPLDGFRTAAAIEKEANYIQ
jgi:hypothetical protein